MDVSRQRGLKQAEHMIAAAEHLSNTAVPVFCTFLSITDFTDMLRLLSLKFEVCDV